MLQKTSEGLPIVRKCDTCGIWLDIESAQLATTKYMRDRIDYVLSHGKCEPCGRQFMIDNGIEDTIN